MITIGSQHLRATALNQYNDNQPPCRHCGMGAGCVFTTYGTSVKCGREGIFLALFFQDTLAFFNKIQAVSFKFIFCAGFKRIIIAKFVTHNQGRGYTPAVNAPP